MVVVNHWNCATVGCIESGDHRHRSIHIEGKIYCVSCGMTILSEPTRVLKEKSLERQKRIGQLASQLFVFEDRGSYMVVKDPEMILLIREEFRYQKSLTRKLAKSTNTTST